MNDTKIIAQMDFTFDGTESTWTMDVWGKDSKVEYVMFDMDPTKKIYNPALIERAEEYIRRYGG